MMEKILPTLAYGIGSITAMGVGVYIHITTNTGFIWVVIGILLYFINWVAFKAGDKSSSRFVQHLRLSAVNYILLLGTVFYGIVKGLEGSFVGAIAVLFSLIAAGIMLVPILFNAVYVSRARHQ